MSINPKSLENLKSYTKGNTCSVGKGRPKNLANLSTTLKRLIDNEIDLKNPLTYIKERRTVGEWINLALIAKAIKGNVPAIQQVYDRVEGRINNNPVELEAKFIISEHVQTKLANSSTDELLEIRSRLEDANKILDVD